MCKRCGKPADGYFEDGLWNTDPSTQEPDAYCNDCADRLLGMADELVSRLGD